MSSKNSNTKEENFRPDPVTLQFEHITIETTRRKKKKTILNNCSGSVKPGQLFGILGPSGSGKTTLLDCLANRKKKGVTLQIGGKILFNGQEATKEQRKRLTGYVAQDDTLLPSFSVEETLEQIVRFRFGYSVSTEFVQYKINKAMKDVGLISRSKIRVGSGGGGKGLSGGQRRRLSIAIELISSAPVLFIDEPTSGLDFAGAFGVMKKIKLLASNGHTIIVVIHQPASQIFHLFDRILLLSCGDKIFCGNQTDAIDYFNGKGYICPPFFNQAEFLLHLVSTDFSSKNTVDNIHQLAKEYDTSDAAIREQNDQPKFLEDGDLDSEKTTIIIGGNAFDNLSKGFFCSSLLTLSIRNVLIMIRNPPVLISRVIVIAFVSVILGLTFYKTGEELNDTGIFSTSGCLFILPAFFAVMSIATLPNLIRERAVVSRERSGDMYGTGPLIISWVLKSVFVTIIVTGECAAISYFMIGLQSDFFLYFLTVWSMFLFVEFLVIFVGVLVPHHVIGMLLVMGVLSGGTATCGFFIIFERINWAIRWLGYVTPQRYVWRAMMRNEFENAVNISSLVFSNGEDIMNYYSFNEDGLASFWSDMGIVFSFIAALGISVVFLLWVKY